MRFHANRSRVSTSGTSVALSAATGAPDATSRVQWIKISARKGNSGVIYVGDSSVSSTLGYELSANDSIEINFQDAGGTVTLNTIYVDASANNQDADWAVILE